MGKMSRHATITTYVPGAVPLSTHLAFTGSPTFTDPSELYGQNVTVKPQRGQPYTPKRYRIHLTLPEVSAALGAQMVSLGEKPSTFSKKNNCVTYVRRILGAGGVSVNSGNNTVPGLDTALGKDPRFRGQ
jgi:hypothetical protein